MVYTDPAAGFQALVNHFPSVIIDTGGAKDNNAKVDIKIRRMKELCRSVQASLAWAVPKSMVKDLGSYAVARLNIRRMTAINENICPKVLFTGMKINFEKELKLEFGTYTEVYDGTDNTSKSRSIPCIAHYPCSNSTGSWEFMNLKTKTRIRRLYWKKMKQSKLIVKFMQKFDEKAELPAVMEPALEQEPSQSIDTSMIDPLVEGQAEVSEQAQVVELEDLPVVEQEQVKISKE